MHTAILIPYYNNAPALRDTLASLQPETGAFDVVLVDDGSAAPPIFDAQPYHFKIHLITLPHNQGIEHALNAGLHYILAQGYEFIARLDVGDLWRPGRLAAQTEFLQAHPGHVIIGSAAQAIDAKAQARFTLRLPETDQAVRRFAALNNPFCHPAIMICASVLKQAGFYSDKFKAAEDYEFFRRLLRYGKGANLPAVWLDYEVVENPGSISYQQRRTQLLSRFKVQLYYFDAVLWQSYWGMLRTLVLLLLPYGLLLKFKSRFWQPPKDSPKGKV